MRPVAVFLLLAAGALVAAPLPKDFKTADDTTRIVGNWKPAGDGVARFQFHADGTLQTGNPQLPGGSIGWTWTNLDPKATPKRVTLTSAAGSFDCVYELRGDRLKLALVYDKKKPIPDSVQTGPGLSFYDLVREKPAK